MKKNMVFTKKKQLSRMSICAKIFNCFSFSREHVKLYSLPAIKPRDSTFPFYGVQKIYVAAYLRIRFYNGYMDSYIIEVSLSKTRLYSSMNGHEAHIALSKRVLWHCRIIYKRDLLAAENIMRFFRHEILLVLLYFFTILSYMLSKF